MKVTTEEIVTIDPNPEKVLAGREEGEKVRRGLVLYLKDLTPGKMTIVFPEHTLSVNVSFFLGLFGRSVESIGEEKFRAKYSFQCEPHIMKNIEYGIERAVMEADPNKRVPSSLELSEERLKEEIGI
jgi:hypothetical protein